MIILGAILIIFFIYILMQYVLNEKQIYFIKYFLYVGLVMLMSVLIIPFFLIRPRHASNICLAALFLNPFFKLFGLRYRIENGAVFDRLGPCVIVANHQSSIDFIGMMHMWPLHILNCTILAKKEIFWALPFGLTAWLAGLEYVDRKNRQNSTQTMGRLTAKIPRDSLSVWIFPEGYSFAQSLIDRLFLLSFRNPKYEWKSITIQVWSLSFSNRSTSSNRPYSLFTVREYL